MDHFWENLRTVIVCLLTCILCIAIHELGHAAAGYVSGGHITEFVLVGQSPHVVLSGRFTPGQEAFHCAAGSALLILAWFCFAAFKPRRNSLAFEVSAMLVAIELLAWLLSALLYPAGPRNYDGWQFLAASAIPPLYVVSACLFIAAVGLLVYNFVQSTKVLHGV